MTGRKYKMKSMIPISRRSARVKRKWLEAAPHQTPGTRKEVRQKRKSSQVTGYSKTSSVMDDEFKALLETAGIMNFYTCLDWSWTSNIFVKDFFQHSVIVEGQLIEYHPFQCQYPLVLTMEKMAQAFHLNLEGIYQSDYERATIDDVKLETRFKLDSTERYFCVASAETKGLRTAGKFASQALFLQQNSSVLTLQHMILLRAALNGEPVAWGKILWKNLVKRVESFHQQVSKSANKSDVIQKLKYLAYAPVVVALLLRVDHDPEHEAWFGSLRTSQTNGSHADSNESDHEFLIDLVANNRRKKAKVIKEELDTEKDHAMDPVYDSASGSTFIAGIVDSEEQVAVGTENLTQGPDDVHDVAAKDLGPSSSTPLAENIQGSTTHLLEDKCESVRGDVSYESPELNDAVPNKTKAKLQDARETSMHLKNTRSDITSERGLESGKPLDGCPSGMEDRVVDVKLSTGDCIVGALQQPDGFNLHAVGKEGDLEIVDPDHGHSETLESTEGVVVTGGDKYTLKPEIESDGDGRMPMKDLEDVGDLWHSVEVVTDREFGRRRAMEFDLIFQNSGENNQKVEDELEHEGQLIKQSPKSPRSSLENPPKSVTEAEHVSASTLVKMVYIVKHFLHGLDVAGVPPNVDLQLKAGKFLDALNIELESRGLQEFSEQTEFFGMDWSMDKIFDAQWSLQDRLRKSEKEFLKLKEELDELFTKFNRDKRSVSRKATSSNPGKLMLDQRNDERERAFLLNEELKIVKDEVKDVKDHIRKMEMVQKKRIEDCMKQRSVLLQRWNEVKFEYSRLCGQMEGLEAKIKIREDILKENEEKLVKESMLRRCCEETIDTLKDEMKVLKGTLSEKTDNLLQTLQERDEGLEAAKLYKEKLARSLEELQEKHEHLVDAVTQVTDLKQRAEKLSDRISVQNGMLDDKNEELKHFKAEIARWMSENSACKLEVEMLSKARRKMELRCMNQMYITQELEERINEIKGKLALRQDRIRKSDELLDLKDQEMKMLKIRADNFEKKLQDCKRTRDLALDMVQKQRGIQDACKRQMAGLKEEREKTDDQLEKVMKRELRLIKELEEEKERLEERLLDQEQQEILSIEEITENKTATELRSQVEKLRVEKKEIIASALQRVMKIINCYKIVMRSYGERSSDSSAS